MAHAEEVTHRRFDRIVRFVMPAHAENDVAQTIWLWVHVRTPDMVDAARAFDVCQHYRLPRLDHQEVIISAGTVPARDTRRVRTSRSRARSPSGLFF